MRTYTLKLSDIRPDPNQPRKNKPQEYIEELGNSILATGLKHPIEVRKDPDKTSGYKYIIVNGECRFLVHLNNKELFDRGTIEAIIDTKEKSELEVFLEQIQDNIVRREMGFLETIQAYKRGIELGATLEDLVNSFGKSRETMTKFLNLADLEPAILMAVDSGQISQEVGLAITRFDKPSERSKALDKARGKSTKRALAALNVYEMQLHQTKISAVEQVKQNDAKSGLKEAGKKLNRFLDQVGTFSNTINLTAAIRANSRELQKVEEFSKLLKKLGGSIEEEINKYKALANK